MRQILHLIVLVEIALLAGLMAPPVHGQGHGAHGQAPTTQAAPPSVRITMDALHAAGGVPPGWRFAVPPGDASAGRQVFVDLECYACHAVKGEQFPLKPGETAIAGPELSGMGSYHPPEYLAESIMNPNAVLLEGPGYIGGDGRSNMPAYPDMTLGQLTNLVAYLKTLGAPEAVPADESAREQVVGGYRVRLLYKKAGAGDPAHRGHHAMAMPPASGRLLVFLTDRASGQSIPYVRVSAKIEVQGKPAQTIKLAPALGPEGFLYGADLALPEATNRITLAIGPTTMRLGAGAPEGLTRTQRVAFEWK